MLLKVKQLGITENFESYVKKVQFHIYISGAPDLQNYSRFHQCKEMCLDQNNFIQDCTVKTNS